MDNEMDDGGWTCEQQRALEHALGIVPKDLPAADRWQQIGAMVEGRTAKECVARYKELAQVAKEKRAQQVDKEEEIAFADDFIQKKIDAMKIGAGRRAAGADPVEKESKEEAMARKLWLKASSLCQFCGQPGHEAPQCPDYLQAGDQPAVVIVRPMAVPKANDSEPSCPDEAEEAPTCSSDDSAAAQREELEVLSSIYGDELTVERSPPSAAGEPTAAFLFDFDASNIGADGKRLKLRFSLPADYPLSAPTPELIVGSLSEREFGPDRREAVNGHMQRAADDSAGVACVFQMTQELTDWLAEGGPTE